MAATYKWAIKTSSKVDQAAKLLRIYCILNDIKVSDTGILVCAYIMVYGFNNQVKEGIVKAGIMGKASSLKNELYVMKRMGILEGARGLMRISSKVVPLNIQEALTQQTILLINLDNR